MLPAIKEQFAEMIPGTADMISPIKVHVIGNKNRDELRKKDICSLWSNI